MICWNSCYLPIYQWVLYAIWKSARILILNKNRNVDAVYIQHIVHSIFVVWYNYVHIIYLQPGQNMIFLIPGKEFEIVLVRWSHASRTINILTTPKQSTSKPYPYFMMHFMPNYPLQLLTKVLPQNIVPSSYNVIDSARNYSIAGLHLTSRVPWKLECMLFEC